MTTLTWTKDMGDIAPTPELEDMTRTAVIVACEMWPTLSPQPRFSGSVFVVAANETAQKLEAACMAHVPIEKISGIARREILVNAVRCAEIYAGAGGAEKGWEAVKSVLKNTREGSGAKRRR